MKNISLTSRSAARLHLGGSACYLPPTTSRLNNMPQPGNARAGGGHPCDARRYHSAHGMSYQHCTRCAFMRAAAHLVALRRLTRSATS